MTLSEFLKVYTKFDPVIDATFVRPWIKCNDGYTLSVQASAYHYCTPRINCADEYTTVEVGFPSNTTPEFFEYSAGGVYGCVPFDIVQKVIEKHGGIKEPDFSNDHAGKWKSNPIMDV